MFKTLQILFVVLPLLSHSGAVRGAESSLHEKDGLTVQLVTAITEITPGEPFLVGLILDTEEGYHTYWKGPGIVGVATNLEWTLPEGFSAGEIVWPAPERVDMLGINAHGYNDRVCLLTEIQVPETIESESITLEAKASWMCCATTCYPGFSDLKLTLPVNQSETPKPKEARYTALFRESLNSVPPVAPDGWTIFAKIVTPEIIELEVGIPDLESMTVEGVYFFAYDLQVNSGEPQSVILTSRSKPKLTFTLKRSDFAPKAPGELAGVIYHPEGWPELNSRHAEVSFAWPTGTFHK